MENNKTIAMRRDQLEKIELDLDENLVSNVIRLIDELNENLAESAKDSTQTTSNLHLILMSQKC